jgi:hypothetical protein
MHVARTTSVCALIQGPGADSQPAQHNGEYWRPFDRLPLHLVDPVLAPPLLAAVDLPLSGQVDWHLFHGAPGDQPDLVARDQTCVDIPTACFALEPAVALNYGARNGLYGRLDLTMHQMVPDGGLRFGRLGGGVPDAPGLRIAVPPADHPAVRSHLGYLDIQLLRRAHAEGWDGFVTWDCTKVDDRQHLTVHVFAHGLARLREVSRAHHEISTCVYDAVPKRTNRFLPVVAVVMDRIAPLAPVHVEEIRDNVTVAAAAPLQLEARRTDVILPPKYDAPRFDTTPWSAESPTVRPLGPGLSEVHAEGRSAVHVDAERLSLLQEDLRREVRRDERGGGWLLTADQVMRAADRLPDVITDARRTSVAASSPAR